MYVFINVALACRVPVVVVGVVVVVVVGVVVYFECVCLYILFAGAVLYLCGGEIVYTCYLYILTFVLKNFTANYDFFPQTFEEELNVKKKNDYPFVLFSKARLKKKYAKLLITFQLHALF